ncbi:MAG: hypothetical protein ACD_5C00299G0003, partial [uncultured bacterium]
MFDLLHHLLKTFTTKGGRTMIKGCKELYVAIAMLKEVAEKQARNLYMPGDGRYQPEELKAFLGYDQWVSWLI